MSASDLGEVTPGGTGVWRPWMLSSVAQWPPSLQGLSYQESRGCGARLSVASRRAGWPCRVYPVTDGTLHARRLTQWEESIQDTNRTR